MSCGALWDLLVQTWTLPGMALFIYYLFFISNCEFGAPHKKQWTKFDEFSVFDRGMGVGA